MKYKHEVFINFRGTDVRRGLLSHLKKELKGQKIGFYVDDVNLEVGDQISSLLTAIEESQIWLVIFSKDYASSKWCLMELEKILECAGKNKQIAVIPVFYKVDPADVRYQRGDYGAAFVQHETREDKVKVQNWKSALTKAADLSGFHYPFESEMDESKLVDDIVEHISRKLRKSYPGESNDLVGIDKNIEWVNSLMTNNSEEIIKIGIWGMGGIGKTTIAQFVFDKFSHQYEGCYFLENIKDELQTSHLNYLRDEAVSKLLGEENPHITGASKAGSFYMRRLSKKKVLLVLDNVNTPKLLKDFLQPIRFGPGSRVIVTSREKQVFTSGVVFHEIHHVKKLNFEESLELFCLNAFNASQRKRGFQELSEKAVAFARGIPLALKVFGSYFHSKSEDIWESALDRLKKYPDTDGEILNVLRFSYDELSDTEKMIFLDIAFFFKGDDKDYVIRQLDAWKFYGVCGMDSLQQKALIDISRDNKIQMHDLIQKMGWQIVGQESTIAGNRSRLNDLEDVRGILNSDRVSDSVEGILLDLSQIGEVALNVDSDMLKKMPNLRLIKAYSPLPIEVPMRIRYFVPKDLLNVHSKRISIIHDFMEESGRLNQSCDNEDMDDVVETIKHLVNKTKGSMLDISNQSVMLANLTELQGIKKLVNYNESDGVLVLVTNGLSGSMPPLIPHSESALKNLMSLGSEIHVKSIHHLFMEGCSVSKELSLSTEEIRSIKNSTLTRMGELNSSVEVFKNLECLDVQALQHDENNVVRKIGMELLNSSTGCFISPDYSDIGDDLQLEITLKDKLPFLRSTHYYRLSNFKENTDSGERKLLVMVDGIRCSEQLSILGFGGSDFQWSYLWCISNSHLVQISVGPQLTHCVEMFLDGISLESFPSWIRHLVPHIRRLSLSGCTNLVSISELPIFIRSLDLSDCVNLVSLPLSIKHFLFLKELSLFGCRNLRSIPYL